MAAIVNAANTSTESAGKGVIASNVSIVMIISLFKAVFLFQFSWLKNQQPVKNKVAWGIGREIKRRMSLENSSAYRLLSYR